MTKNYSLVDMKFSKRNTMTPLKSITHWKTKQVKTESPLSKKYKCLTFKSVKKKNNWCNPLQKDKAQKICWSKSKVRLKTLRKSWTKKSKTVSKKFNKLIWSTKSSMKSTFSSKLTVKKNWLFADKEINS